MQPFYSSFYCRPNKQYTFALMYGWTTKSTRFDNPRTQDARPDSTPITIIAVE